MKLAIDWEADEVVPSRNGASRGLRRDDDDGHERRWELAESEGRGKCDAAAGTAGGSDGHPALSARAILALSAAANKSHPPHVS